MPNRKVRGAYESGAYKKASKSKSGFDKNKVEQLPLYLHFLKHLSHMST